MYLAIIIFVVIVLLAIVVAINFADSDVSNSVRLIVSSIIIIILAAGVYYLTMPLSIVTSASVKNQNDSLSINTDTLINQKEKPVKKKNEQADYSGKKNIEPQIIKPHEPSSARDTSIKQTKINPPKNDVEATGEITKKYDKYKVISKAYFHNKPDESTRRNAFIIHWNNAVLIPSDERNGFIYVTFTNHLGQISKGWLLKSDLKRVEE